MNTTLSHSIPILRAALCAAVIILALPKTARAQPPSATSQPISLQDWRPRADGGHPPEFHFVPGAGAEAGLSVTYTDQPPGWGNLETPITISPSMTAFDLQIIKRSAAPGAQLTLGLAEPDGDLWFGEILWNGRPFSQWPNGAASIEVPVSQFHFDGRGNRIRQMETANKLFLVCNNGSSSFLLKSITMRSLFNPAASTAPPNDPVHPVRGKMGSAAILTGPFPDNPAAANIPTLTTLLQGAGYGVTPISGGNASDPQVLTRQNFDLLVLPNSPFFPAAGARALRSYLKSGGKLLCFGGYALDVPVVYAEDRWIPAGSGATAAQADRPTATSISLNTRSGMPGDTMSLQPEQIGMFDPASRFENATLVPSGKGFPSTVETSGEAQSGKGLPSYNLKSGEGLPSYSLSSGKGLSSYSLSSGKSLSSYTAPDKPREGPESGTIPIPPQIAADSPRATPRPEGTRYPEPANPAARQAPADLRQAVLRGGAAGSLNGYEAVSVIGNDSPVFLKVWARTEPELFFREPGGRTGPLFSVSRIYDGPYRGSAWAFCGVTNRDVLELPAVQAAIPGILHSLTRDVTLHDLTTGYAAYQPEEHPDVMATVDNFRPGALRGSLEIIISTMEPGKDHILSRIRQPITVSALDSLHWRQEITGVRPPPGSVCRVQAILTGDDGRELDRMETGFVMADTPAARERWPHFSFQHNSFLVDSRPQFLTGTNLTGAVFCPGNDENPLQWERDFALMQQHGIRMSRVLHFSPFVTWLKTGKSAAAADLAGPAPEDLMRRMDALVQIAAHHDIAIFLSLHDWIDVNLSDADLKAESDFGTQVAQRYRDAGNVLFDIQNEPQVGTTADPDVQRHWNDYLREKYGSDAALRAAWTLSPPEGPIGRIPWKSGTDRWADVRTWDANHFKTVLLNRWTSANAAALRAGNPTAPVTVGYLPSMPPADKILGQQNLDFSNMHYYGSPDGFLPEFALTDRRFEGKGLSLGEFGAQAEHNQRTNGEDVTANDATWFHRVGLATVGMGGSLQQCWSWKDMNGVVFPWGIVGRDGQPKRTLEALAAVSKELQDVIPGVAEPDVYLLIPDSHRQGAHADTILNALHNTVTMLLRSHVAFGVINEESVDKLPANARAVVWPIPFCPGDAAYARMLKYVQNGGALYVSGDVSYGPLRQHDRTERLQELCGVTSGGEIYPDIQLRATVPGMVLSSPCINARPAGAIPTLIPEAGTVFLNHPGKGLVFYTPDPLELHSTDAQLYREFFRRAGITPLPVQPDDPDLQVFRVKMRNGAAGEIVINTTAAPLDVTAAGIHATLPPQDGKLFAATVPVR